MCKNRGRFLGIVFGLFMMQFSAMLFSPATLAATSDTTLLNKTLANSLYRCYHNVSGDRDKYMFSSITPAEAVAIGPIMTNAGKTEQTIKVPTKYGNTLRDGDISCEELFKGWDVGLGTGKISGLLQNTGLSGENLLGTLGYQKDSAGGGQCFYFEYSYFGNVNARTNKICTSSSGVSSDSSEKNGNLHIYNSWNQIYIVDQNTYDSVTGTYGREMNIGQITTPGVLPEGAINSACDRLRENWGGAYECSRYRIVQNEMSASWVKTEDSAEKALRALTEYNSFDESRFTDQDAYDLYMGYLFGVNSIYDGLWVDSNNGCSTNKNDSNSSIPFLSSSGEEVMWCEVRGEGLSSDKKVNVLRNGRWYYLEDSVGPYGVIDRLRNLDISNITLATVDAETGQVSETIAVASEGKCLSEGGAGSLGWIVCPLLEWMGKASDQIYTNLVAPALTIESQLFSDNEDGSAGRTRIAWGTFRDIANVCFAILFLVIIFSQLTGIGIDNYGIKKALPKLVVAAILINLSYLICLIAVDLSNILGIGLRRLFDELGNNLATASVFVGDQEFKFDAAMATGITGVGILGALVAGGVAIYANPAILLSLLISALGIIISLFFLFVLLSIREAAILVLVVISPIAIVLYSLPNTKRIFDRWLKLFGGLLMVFPICGLLVGAGNYISKLLISVGGSNGFFAAFTAMIVGIVPIFFIPMVLKGSFTAMGKVGTSLAGLGTKARLAGTKAMRGTDVYKSTQERGTERRTRLRAGIDTSGQAMNLTGVGRFLRGGKRSIARSRAQYLRDQDAQIREDSLMGVGFEAASIAQEKRAGADEVSNYMMLINNRTDNGANEGALQEIFDEYAVGKNKFGMIAAARVAGRRKDTAARFMSNTIMSGVDSRGNAYDQSLMRDVAKEMSEGERAGNYRSGMPVGFEYASKVNQGVTMASFQEWSANPANISDAMQHHVTNSSELVGAQNSSLRYIANMMEAGGMSEEEISRVRNLARETIQNRGTTGVWDTTKEENIYRIAYGADDYQNQMIQDRVAVNMTRENIGQADGSMRVRDARSGGNVGDATSGIRGNVAEERSPRNETSPVRVQVRQVRTEGRDQTNRQQSEDQRRRPLG